MADDVVIGRAAEHHEPIITVHVPWPHLRLRWIALRCLTFQGGGSWSDEECSVRSIDATGVQWLQTISCASSCPCDCQFMRCLLRLRRVLKQSIVWVVRINTQVHRRQLEQAFDQSTCPDWHHRPAGEDDNRRANGMSCRKIRKVECGGPLRGVQRCDRSLQLSDCARLAT